MKLRVRKIILYQSVVNCWPVGILALSFLLGPYKLLSQSIVIDSVMGNFEDAIEINYATRHGIFVRESGSDGVRISNSSTNAIRITDPGQDGIDILRGGQGIGISETSGRGISINRSGSQGLWINNSGGDGIGVQSSDGDGIRVSASAGYGINVWGIKNQNPATPEAHIARISNSSSGSGPDVLALRVSKSNPTDLSNFITFFNVWDNAIGAIEGNGSGGISYSSGGADFAEYLPVASTETLEPGDIVGIKEGMVSLNTHEVQALMVITNRPIVLGNQPASTEGFEKVSFIGQVPVKVRGTVHAGDWIVASGDQDGTGVAIDPSDVTMHHKVVGRAWETNTNIKTKKVNVVVGLDQTESLKMVIQSQQNEILQLYKTLESLEDRVKRIEDK